MKFERVRKPLSKYRAKPQIVFQSTLEPDPGLSSVDLVESITKFEKEYGIEISDKDIGKFVCSMDVVNCFEVHI